MKSTTGRCALAVVAALVCFSMQLRAADEKTPQPEFTCRIRLSPQHIAVYEPVRLDVKVQYHGTQPRNAALPHGSSGAFGLRVERLLPSPVVVASLSAYQLHTAASVDDLPPLNSTVVPGASTLTSLNVLYDQRREKFLFSEPGTYRVTLSCEIALMQPDQSIESFNVHDYGMVTVTDVATPDKELWRRSSLASMDGRGGPTKVEITRSLEQLGELIAQYPRSPYRPYALAILSGALPANAVRIPAVDADTTRAAYLEELYSKYPRFAWRDYVTARLYQVLLDNDDTERAGKIVRALHDDLWAPPQLKSEVRQYQPPILFSRDKRLQQNAVFESPQPTPLKDVLDDLSRQTGVPLSVHPDLSRRSLRSLRLTKTLQQVMRSLSVYKAEWVRDGNGYKLVPAER